MQNALSRRLGPIAASEIDNRIAAIGGQHAISMNVSAQALETFRLFEGHLNATQASRLLLLKEINGIEVFRSSRQMSKGQAFKRANRR
ncbi:hypothetical protein [Bradyrhizobium sp. Ec3.3]|uniref:hypothetical protein n=1 Tax=Bradyrhizobium sp. Ec3.3 TaxID=189753 RepID=UPI0003F4BF34|nr:hypothetical protein [Bradyrhizobium sp. Ec3.3]